MTPNRRRPSVPPVAESEARPTGEISSMSDLDRWPEVPCPSLELQLSLPIVTVIE
jgi:hypothetical protein